MKEIIIKINQIEFYNKRGEIKSRIILKKTFKTK